MEKNRCEIDGKYKWNLNDFIKDEEEYNLLEAEIKLLADKIVNMKDIIITSSDNLLCYLDTSVLLDELLEKIYVYSNLYHYQDMQDKLGLTYKKRAEQLLDDITVKLSFVHPLLMSLNYDVVKKYVSENKKLNKYGFYLEKLYRYQAHVLSEKEEKILAEATNALGTSDEVFSALDNVDINLGYIKDENKVKVLLTNSNYVKYLNSKNKDVRKDAFKKMYEYFKNHNYTLAASYNGLLKETKFLTKVRKYNNPVEHSLYSDNIEYEFYEKFINNISKYLDLNHKYMRIRNNALGYKQHMYDVYVDLVKKESENIEYSECQKILNDCLKPLGDNYLKDLNKSFKEGWIDVYPNKYKRSGAYQWGSFGVHPYVSLNYENNFDSVSTLAHELGHAMHTYYSNENNSYIDANYPIFLAEIASTVNEVLVDDYFYQNAKTDDEKILYLQNFLDKVRTTIFRQTMFAEFEMIMHNKSWNNEVLLADDINNIYYDLNKKYFGKSIVVDKEISYEWSRIPHFYTPFYVYKYATGLISALAIVKKIKNKDQNALENYLDFLKSGGKDYPINTLKKAGVDINDNKTIKLAFDLFEEKLDELEKLIDKRGSKHE